MSSANLLQRIREGVIGQYQPLSTPYGEKPLVYADYTASGRALDFIEAQIQQKVLPYYANTHSESSLTGAQTTAHREHARSIIANALGGKAQDRIIFCGSGATAAINKFIDMLNLRLPRDLDERQGFSAQINQENRPVIFLGPYEHHSNELPWRETIAEVVPIPLDGRGQIDQDALKTALLRYAGRPLRIGSFSAASNVTGVRSDVSGISRLLKSHGALACWDYAAAGPYVGIEMNEPGAEMDAVFLSPHKFVGGPGTPGILAIKSELCNNTVPAVVGGGTVAFVSSQRHRYLDDTQRREEAGTPAIIESIRAGLVVGLQQHIGTQTIERLEQARLEQADQQLKQTQQLQVLGPACKERLSIYSLRFRHEQTELHYGFVVALLNDLFGIQARGGCSCAGPYGHSLLGIDEDVSQRLDAQVAAGFPALRPGWVRVNFNYFISDAEFGYQLSALRLVAEQGWRLLPAYQLNPSTGLWSRRGHARGMPTQLDPSDTPSLTTPLTGPEPDFQALLAEAESLLSRGSSTADILAAKSDPPLPLETEQLRWFVTPTEAAEQLAPALAQPA